MIQLIEWGHKFAYVMTAELSWHVQNYDLIWALVTVQHPFLRDLDYELIKP